MAVYKIRDASTSKFLGCRAIKFTKSGVVWKNRRTVIGALNKLRKKKNIRWDYLEIIEFSLKEEMRTSAKEFYLEYLFLEELK